MHNMDMTEVNYDDEDYFTAIFFVTIIVSELLWTNKFMKMRLNLKFFL